MENLLFWLLMLLDAGLIVFAWWYIKHKPSNMAEAFKSQLEHNEFEKRMKAKYGTKASFNSDGIESAQQDRFNKIFIVSYVLAVIQMFCLIGGAFFGVNWIEHINIALVLTGGGLILMLLPLIFQSSNKLGTALLLIAILAFGAIIKTGFDYLLIYNWKILIAVLVILVAGSLIAMNSEKSRIPNR